MRTPGRRCERCRLALAGQAGCPDCAWQPPAYDGVAVGFDYEVPGDLLIHMLKVQRRFLLAEPLSGILAHAVRRDLRGLPAHAVLVPVPSRQGAVRERGFNPAAELARHLAWRLGLACRPAVLQRVHEGLRQASLGRSERRRHAEGLYRCTATLNGAIIAVVDDVLTTGSTLDAIAAELKRAGAAAVFGLVLARTPLATR